MTPPTRFVHYLRKRDAQQLRLPCVKGKRSAVAAVNDSPVDCQSRDRIARRRLSREQRD